MSVSDSSSDIFRSKINRPRHPMAMPKYPVGVPTKRGYMRQMDDNLSKKGNPRYLVRFQYNPNAIGVSYTMNEDINNPLYEVDEVVTMTKYKFRGSMGLSFELDFDRSFDLMTEPGNKLGVLEDIYALEKINRVHEYGYLSMTAIQFFFGQGAASTFVQDRNLSFQQGFTFVGYITSLSVNYLRFSTNMVPMTARVSISAAQLISDPELIGRKPPPTITSLGPDSGFTTRPTADQLARDAAQSIPSPNSGGVTAGGAAGGEHAGTHNTNPPTATPPKVSEGRKGGV